jgi:hypothetical protein
MEKPDSFFTEADFVFHFRHTLLSGQLPSFLKRHHRTKGPNAGDVSLIHSEYNRFNAKGRYDVAILNPEFVKTSALECVANVNSKTRKMNARPKIPPLVVAVEFKFSKKGRPAMFRAAADDLTKLKNDSRLAKYQYFVFLVRQCNANSWKAKWRILEPQAKLAKKHVCSIFARSQVDPISNHGSEIGVTQIGSWQRPYATGKRRPTAGRRTGK